MFLYCRSEQGVSNLILRDSAGTLYHDANFTRCNRRNILSQRQCLDSSCLLGSVVTAIFLYYEAEKIKILYLFRDTRTHHGNVSAQDLHGTLKQTLMRGFSIVMVQQEKTLENHIFLLGKKSPS